MDIYLMRDGTRHGPLRLFQVKEMLDRGEAAAGDLGWHPGLGQWQPLGEIEALTPYLPRTTPPPLPAAEEADPAAPAIRDRGPAAAVRPLTRWGLFGARALPRFLARLFDSTLWFSATSALAVGAGWIQPAEVVFPKFWFLSGQGLLWVLVEAWLLSRFATTPGKWIFSIHVEHVGGGPPDIGRALKRAFFIWVCAWGLGHPTWALFGSMVALLLYLQNGRMVWDHLVRTEVVHGRASPARWFGFGVVMAVYMGAKLVIMLTQPLPDDLDPEVRRQIEESRERLRSSFQIPPTPAP